MAAGDGSYALLNYASEKQNTTVSLPGQSSGVFISRDQRYVFSPTRPPTRHTCRIVAGYPATVERAQRLPRLHQSSGSAALAFVQDSNPGL